MRRFIPALALAGLTACDLQLDFTYYACTVQSDCPPSWVCASAQGVCLPPDGGMPSGTSSGASTGRTSSRGSSSGGVQSSSLSSTGQGQSSSGVASSGGPGSSSSASSSSAAGSSGSTSSGTGTSSGSTTQRSGQVSLLAGGNGSGDTQGPFASASFSGPAGLALAGDRLYVADSQNGALRYLDLDAGLVTLITLGAGNGTPQSVASGAGWAYFGDSMNGNLDAMDLSGGSPSVIMTDGDLDAYVDVTNFNPLGLAFVGTQTLYVADSQGAISDNCIEQFTLSPPGTIENVTTFAGVCDLEEAGYADGPVATAAFNSPAGVAVDAAGNVFVADTGNNVIREVSSGNVSTLAGSDAGMATTPAGPALQTLLNQPTNLCVDSRGRVFFTEASAVGVVQTHDGGGLFVDLLEAGSTIQAPYGIALDEAGGNLYVSDYVGNAIYLIRGF